MDRWFETAQMKDEAERLSVVASLLKDSAQTWWESLVRTGVGVPATWDEFKKIVRSQFLPMAVEQWAMLEITALQRKHVSDVRVYTASFQELDMLVPGRLELDRILAYQAGLPQAYAMEVGKKSPKSLQDAIQIAINHYNAVWVAGASVGSSSSSARSAVHQMEVEGSSVSEQDTSSATSSSSSAPSLATLQGQIAQLTAVMTQSFNRKPWGNSGGGRGGRGRWRGRGGNRSNTRSPSPSVKDLGISREVAEQRRRSGACLRCGINGHMIRECTAPVKTTN